MNRILVTSALPYANGPLHIGHLAGAYLPADIYTRYHRLKGRDVIHICGTDEHGVAITIAAEKEGLTPKALVDKYYRQIKASFDRLGIVFDNFSRTSLPLHHRVSQQFFLRIYEKGYVYRKDVDQFYCPNCRRFLPDRYVVGTCPHCGHPEARGDQCEACGRWLEPTDLIEPRCAICGAPPVLRRTFQYYFTLSRFGKPLKEWLEAQDFWKDNVRNTALSWIRDGLQDRPITRDLEWGVPVPLEEARGKVLYVWFDAPIGYISSTIEWAEKIGDPERWKAYWLDPETRLVHFIGKDNIVFHALVWPAMLMAHGDYILPWNIPANEFLNLEGQKLSTSRGWAFWADELLDEFPPDYIRFGLAAILPEMKDADFNLDDFRRRVNTELADILGNFVQRTLAFIQRYMGGVIPPKGREGEEERALLRVMEEAPVRIGAAIEAFEMRRALREVLELAAEGNRYFDRKRPWEKRKTDPEDARTTLHHCALLIRALSVVMEPFLPFSAQRIREMMRLPQGIGWEEAAVPVLPEGQSLGKVEVLYRKVEEAQVERLRLLLRNRAQGKKEVKSMAEEITIEEFGRLDIRIGTIVEAERIPGADKLLKLKVDIGDRVVQLVAGIAREYEPQEIVGKQVPVLVNLKPAKIRGELSEGMILAAVEPDGRATLLHPDKPVQKGARVR